MSWAAYGDNLMPAPGAETVEDSQTAEPIPGISFSEKIPSSGWNIQKSSGTCIMGITDKESHSGNYCVFYKIKSKNASGDFQVLIKLTENINRKGIEDFSIPAFKPGSVYYFSFWVKAEGHFSVKGRYLEWEQHSDKATLKYMGIHSCASLSPSPTWTKYKIAFATSSHMQKILPVIQICGKSDSDKDDIVFIDDVEILEFEEKFPESLPVRMQQVNPVK